MKELDAVEIHPCVVVGCDTVGNEVMEQCEENDPNIACWAVYAHVQGEGLLHVKDFDSKEEAERGVEILRRFWEALQ